MSARHDAIVIGAGHNGLVAATTLAKAGRKVLVLEARDDPGGAATTEEIAPGFRVPALAHLLIRLDPTVEQEMALESHGLRYAQRDLSSVALDPEGRHLVIDEKGLDGLGGRAIEARDREAHRRLCERLRGYAGALKPFLSRTPPRLGSSRWADNANLMRLGWAIRRQGREQMREFLRIVLLNVADLVEDEIEDPLLQAAIALDAVLGGHAGPRSPNTVLTLLHRLAGEGDGLPAARALPVGGMGAVTEAMVRAFRSAGGELRCGAPVSRLRVDTDHVTGVVLSDGSEIEARSVLTSTNPKHAFLDLLGAEHLDAGFALRVTQIRMKGATGKLNIALRAAPEFKGLPPERLRDRLLIAPSIDDMEAAFNPTKYGELPETPPLEVTVPTIADPSLAPEGAHVLSAVVQYAPYDLKVGWAASTETFKERLLNLLESYAPGLKGNIVEARFLSPKDIEARLGTAGGHWHHGELIVDQMLMLRPLYGAAQYDTPVAGYYLCGAGTHPGGDVTGTAGRNAARRVLELEKRP